MQKFSSQQKSAQAPVIPFLKTQNSINVCPLNESLMNSLCRSKTRDFNACIKS